MDSKLRISAAYLSKVAWEIELTGRRSTWTWAREAKAGLSIAHVKYYPSLLQDKYYNLTRHCPNIAQYLYSSQIHLTMVSLRLVDITITVNDSRVPATR